MLKIQIFGKDFNYINDIFNEINIKINPKAEEVRISSEEEDSINYLKKYMIDIFLLDLDDIDTKSSTLIKFMKSGNNFTRFIVISRDQKNALELVNEGLKIYYSFNKEQELDKLITVIDNLADTLNDKKAKITSFLEIFCFNKSSAGYKFLFETIHYCLNNGYSRIENIKDLYDEIHSYYNEIEYRKAYWNIDKILSTIGQTTDERIRNKYFSYSNGYPTVKVFLNTAIQELNK